MLISFFIGGISLTHHVQALFFFGSLCYTSHAGFIFIGGVSLTHPMLASFLHIPCWLYLYRGSFYDTSHAGFIFIPCWFSYISRASFTFVWGVSVTYPMLALLFCGEFLLHIPSWLFFFFFFFFQSGEFVLYIPCWLNFYVGSFSYTSPAALSFSYTPHGVLIFMQGVSLTHPVLASFFFFFFFIWGFSLTHPVLVSFLYRGSFSYISRFGFIFIWGVCSFSYTSHAGFILSGRFSYTSCAGFIFICGVSLTHPVLDLFFCG